MTVDDFFAAIAEANIRIPGVHTTHAGISSEGIKRWESEHGVRLPQALAELLHRSNGIGLHQNWYDGEPIYLEGAYHFFPLEQIVSASQAMYNETECDPSDPWSSWMAFGEGPDSTLFFVFDRNSGHFLTVEPIVPEEAEDRGTDFASILELVNPRAID